MLFAQISDCHITAPDALAYGRFDNAERLRRTIRVLNALEPRPDLVIASGDLTQSGMKSEYAVLRGLLDTLEMPVFPCMGNHDARAAFRIAFSQLSQQIDRPGFIQYVVEGFPLRLIILDTVTGGSDEPAFCEVRLDWLRRELSRSNEPTVIVMHHPPFPSGVGWVDAERPGWSAELGSVLRQFSCVRAIVCGHVHRAMHRVWSGIPVSTAPAVAPQVELRLSPNAAPAFSAESPGFLMHRWDGEELVTCAASTDGFSDIVRL
ncbi:MAG: phosphodiesterase [Gammaproteobacteria bacterium]